MKIIIPATMAAATHMIPTATRRGMGDTQVDIPTTVFRILYTIANQTSGGAANL
jgi:hypothetical protein